MRSRVVIIILSALVAAACQDRAAITPELSEWEKIRVEVTVDGLPASKASGFYTGDGRTDSQVNSLQVLVFKDGSLDGYGSTEGRMSSYVLCTQGRREVYAVVNAPDLSWVTTRDELLGTVSYLSGELDNFQMIGSVTESMYHDKGIRVTVGRLACRVVLKAVRNAIPNSVQAGSFRIVRVSLTNIAGDVPYGLPDDYRSSVWFNRRGYEPGRSLGSAGVDLPDVTVPAGETYSTAHCFYTYPNAEEPIVGIEEGQEGYTARRARLVVSVEINGMLYHYPIVLPELRSNKSYEIQMLEITRTGNEDNGRSNPDDATDTDQEKAVLTFEQQFPVSVNDWTLELMGDSGIVNF